MISTCPCSALPRVESVARQLRFSPVLESLAAKVVQSLEGGFNAMHLRLEEGMKDWVDKLGGEQVGRGEEGGAPCMCGVQECTGAWAGTRAASQSTVAAPGAPIVLPLRSPCLQRRLCQPPDTQAVARLHPCTLSPLAGRD